MRLALNAILAVSAVAFTAVCLPLATPVSATSCDDVKIIFARGSGQSLRSGEYQTFEDELSSALATRQDLSYSFYELGTTAQNGYKYPAVEMSFFNVISAAVSAGTAAEYGQSVTEGSAELISYIDSTSASCPHTKFVLAGYSQGAQVISLSTSKIDPSNIIYAATFGDPKLYLPEGQGIDPPACHGNNFSDYRAYAPNCKTANGSLGAKIPYQESGWTGKLGLYCNDQDLICGAGLNLSSSGNEDKDLLERIRENAMSAHVSYANQGIIKKAAKTISEKITATFPSKPAPKKSESKNQSKYSLILLDYSYVSEGFYPNLSEAKFKIREIYNSSDSSSMVFYNNSNRNYENYYPLDYRYGGSIDDLWNGRLSWNIDTENTLEKRINYVLEHSYWPEGSDYTFYILAAHLSESEKVTISKLGNRAKIIYLTDDSTRSTFMSHIKTTKDIFSPFSQPAYAESISTNLDNAAAVLVSLNDAPLGITTAKSIKIEDAKPGDKIILTPIGKDGNIGEQKKIVVSDTGYGDTGENTSVGTTINVPITGNTALAPTTPLTPNCGKL